MGILKTAREKGQVKYQDRPIRITSDYLTTFKTRDRGKMYSKLGKTTTASPDFSTQQNYIS